MEFVLIDSFLQHLRHRNLAIVDAGRYCSYSIMIFVCSHAVIESFHTWVLRSLVSPCFLEMHLLLQSWGLAKVLNCFCVIFWLLSVPIFVGLDEKSLMIFEIEWCRMLHGVLNGAGLELLRSLRKVLGSRFSHVHWCIRKVSCSCVTIIGFDIYGVPQHLWHQCDARLLVLDRVPAGSFGGFSVFIIVRLSQILGHFFWFLIAHLFWLICRPGPCAATTTLASLAILLLPLEHLVDVRRRGALESLLRIMVHPWA